MHRTVLLSLALLILNAPPVLFAAEALPAAAETPADAAPATAQEDSGEQAASEPGDTAAPAGEAAVDAALAEEIRAAEAASASAGAPAGSNETFVPSVQISEDLSVSFPVDI